MRNNVIEKLKSRGDSAISTWGKKSLLCEKFSHRQQPIFGCGRGGMTAKRQPFREKVKMIITIYKIQCSHRFFSAILNNIYILTHIHTCTRALWAHPTKKAIRQLQVLQSQQTICVGNQEWKYVNSRWRDPPMDCGRLWRQAGGQLKCMQPVNPSKHHPKRAVRGSWTTQVEEGYHTGEERWQWLRV